MESASKNADEIIKSKWYDKLNLARYYDDLVMEYLTDPSKKGAVQNIIDKLGRDNVYAYLSKLPSSVTSKGTEYSLMYLIAMQESKQD
ncbi:MAG: hypothetical protein RLZZ69_2646, partial [Cyanobacteriota bacterium]